MTPSYFRSPFQKIVENKNYLTLLKYQLTHLNRLSPFIRWGKSRWNYDTTTYFNQLLCHKRSLRDNVAPISPNRSERPYCRTGNRIRHRHPPCLAVVRSENYPSILDHNKSYPSGVHTRLSIVILLHAIFYAVLLQSGMDTPPYGATDHQHDLPKIPRYGSIQNYILLFDVYITVPTKPG